MTAQLPAVLIVTPVLPYPPDRGGKADVWRRALALRECGVTVLLACPCNGDATDGLMRQVASEVGIELVLYARRSLEYAIWRWLFDGLSLPLFSVKRLPTDGDVQALIEIAQKKGINVVVSEGPWLWPLVKKIGQVLRCPKVYRSHNIEASYMRRQRQLERSSIGRVSMFLSFFGLRRFERRAIKESDLLLDISADDLSYWKHPCSRCLPPIPAPLTVSFPMERTEGLLFLGNLRAPNNLAGLRLLLEEILPEVRRYAPELPCHIVGSGPDVQTERWIVSSGAILHKDVAEPMAWLVSASCIVNPVRDGSGVQLKTLDMLQTDRPIVTFPQGLRGLPLELHDAVAVAATPTDFIDAILKFYRQGFPPVERVYTVRKAFDNRAFFRFLAEVVT